MYGTVEGKCVFVSNHIHNSCCCCCVFICYYKWPCSEVIIIFVCQVCFSALVIKCRLFIILMSNKLICTMCFKLIFRRFDSINTLQLVKHTKFMSNHSEIQNFTLHQTIDWIIPWLLSILLLKSFPIDVFFLNIVISYIWSCLIN